MFAKIEDFAAEWTSEADLTATVLDALTDDSLGQEVIEGRRTLGQIAWHLVQSLHYMAASRTDDRAHAPGRTSNARCLRSDLRYLGRERDGAFDLSSFTMKQTG